MQVTLENVGLLPHVNFKVDGLTIIAGENGVGKSTLIKSLYCIFEPYVDLDEKKNKIITHELNRIMRLLLNLKEDALPTKELVDFIIKTRSVEDSDKIGEKISFIEKHANLSVDEHRIIEEIEYVKFLYSHNEEIIKILTKDLFSIEFSNITQVPHYMSNGCSLIRMHTFDKDCDIEINNGFVKISGEANIFSNIFYYDTPYSLDGSFSFDHEYRSSAENNHRKQMHQCLLKPAYKINTSKIDNEKILSEYNSKLNHILRAKSVKTENGIEYQTNENFKLNSRNMATGIKLFSMIDILLKKNMLNEKTLLILDEPEVHIHPLWIENLAEIIVFLSNVIKVKIVVTTHNPQLLMAIDNYASKYVQEISAYFIDNNENNIVFSDVSNDLSPIYIKMRDGLEMTQMMYEDRE